MGNESPFKSMMSTVTSLFNNKSKPEIIETKELDSFTGSKHHSLTLATEYHEFKADLAEQKLKDGSFENPTYDEFVDYLKTGREEALSNKMNSLPDGLSDEDKSFYEQFLQDSIDISMSNEKSLKSLYNQSFGLNDDNGLKDMNTVFAHNNAVVMTKMGEKYGKENYEALRELLIDSDSPSLDDFNKFTQNSQSLTKSNQEGVSNDYGQQALFEFGHILNADSGVQSVQTLGQLPTPD